MGNPSGTSTPWGGPEISQAPDAFDPFAGMEAPQQEKSPYSFLDNPGASDALVAFGAAMLKAPDFNTGLGDAALAVNRVARENRPIGEAEYARAKQLAMLDAIKRGKGGTGGSGKMEIDYSTLYNNSQGHSLFAATDANGNQGMYNQNTGEFSTGPQEDFEGRDSYSSYANRSRRLATKDAEFESDYAKNVPAIAANVVQFDNLAKLAADPSTAIDTDFRTRVGREVERLAPGWGLTDFDPNNISEFDNRIKNAALSYARQSFQGQGQVTEYERKMIFEAIGQAGTLTKDSAVKMLTAMRDIEQRKIDMFTEWQTMDESTKADRFGYNFGKFVSLYLNETNKRQMGMSGGGSPGSESGGRKPLTDIFN
jgi:hypothetical protein